MHVDETGWRTRGEGRALWTATTPQAAFFQIAEHCNREQFDALIGTSYPGIVVSDRWNGYSHLDPTAARCAGRTCSATSAATQKGSPSRRPSASTASSSPARCSPRGAPTSTSTTTATGSRPRSRRSRPSYEQLLEDASPKKPTHPLAPAVRQQPAQGLARALDLHHHRRGRADQQPRRTRAPRTGHPPKTLARHPKRRRRAVRRTRPLRRGHLPPATPLAVHLPQRTHRHSQPRRPVPRAHLSPGLNAYDIQDSGPDGTGHVTRWFQA